MALWSKKGKPDQPPPPSKSNGPGATAAKPAGGAGGTAAKPAAATKPAAQPSAADLQQREVASARLLFRLGEVVSVLMRVPRFRALPLGEVQALVVPPLVSGQFLVAEARSKSKGVITPVATALWAKVSKEVDKRLSENLDKPIKLAPNEWTSAATSPGWWWWQATRR
jgi:hemolysin-activating ACP:hemolysin acyltransferase